MSTVQDGLLTVAEASGELRVHPNTTRALIRAGLLPALRVGRQYRIKREALQSLEMETARAAKAIADEAPPLSADQVAALRAAGLDRRAS